MDADWHRKHRLGSTASLDRRLAWHLEHAQVCDCREMPESIRAEAEARGLNPPPRRER